MAGWCTGGMGALVGRDREVAAVRRFVGGPGGALLVVGEAGIGKSRLLAETVAEAGSAGLVVLSGRAVPGGGTYRPLTEALLAHTREIDAEELGPFRAALGRIVAGWSGEEAGSAGADPLIVLGEGILRLLVTVGRGAGCLLVLDDLHWADPDTVALVEYLAGAGGVLVAVAARDDQPGLSPAPGPYGGAVGRLVGQPGVTTLRLHRLDDDAVAVLAGHHAGDRPIPDGVLEALVARAEGLPLLVEELLAGSRDGAAPVPATMAVLVARRMAALDGPSREIVQAAAVLGAEPDWDLLAPVSGHAEPVAALRAATDVGLLMSAGGRLRWRHMLVRDAVLATLLPPEHVALARRAADRLDERGGPGDDALAADLLAEAGQTARAAAIWLRLARRDIARGAVRTAQELLDRTVALGVAPARVAIDRVRLLCLRGRVPDALEAGVEVLADVTGDEHAELCLELARAAVLGGRWEQARHYVERAGRPDDQRSAVLAAEAAFGAGDTDQAAELAGAAAERAARPDVLCAALVVVGRCASLSDHAAASAAFARAAQCAAENGLVPRRIEALLGLGVVDLSRRGDPGQLAQARELALQSGMPASALSMDVILTDHLMTVDGPVAVEPAALRTAERAARLRLTGLQALSETFAAAARAVEGDAPGMHALLDAATARADPSLEVAAVADAVRALPHLMAWDLPGASALLDRGMARLVGHEPAAPLVFWGLWALLRTVVADHGEQARAIVRGAHAGLRETNRAALVYAEAVVAGRAGRGGVAADLLATGDGMLGGQPWWRRLLRLIVLEAAVLDGWGDPVPELRADLAAFERDGPAAFARTCRDLLRQAGAPTRRGRGTTPVPPPLRALGVTSREMDVLVLVAGGLTNAEVGGRLYLSPRTVETHVANLLVKTGSRSRSDLRTLAP
jgi:DNA-binding CsgD family transcriptional regulator